MKVSITLGLGLFKLASSCNSARDYNDDEVSEDGEDARDGSAG